MDGTLVDTEPYWLQAESDLVARAGGVWTPEDGLQLVGSGLERSALILQSRGVELTVEEIVDDYSPTGCCEQIPRSVPWRPGARELLLEIRDAGIPTALVTMSLRQMALSSRRLARIRRASTSSSRVTSRRTRNRIPSRICTAAERLGVDHHGTASRSRTPSPVSRPPSPPGAT